MEVVTGFAKSVKLLISRDAMCVSNVGDHVQAILIVGIMVERKVELHPVIA
jgi:hypothetical protein